MAEHSSAADSDRDDDGQPGAVSELGNVVGKPTRLAVSAAVKGHVAVLKGKPLRAAISEQLAEHEKLGGKERRFVAFATRELSRHLRRLDLSARAHGWPPSKLQLTEDQAIMRFALWRREMTGATAKRVMLELALPGPVRPRSLPDSVIAKVVEHEAKVDLGVTPVDRAANQHSFPTWLAEAIAASAASAGLGTDALDSILAALNREPFMTFRARPSGSRDALLEVLAADGFSLVPCAEWRDALRADTESRAVFDSRYMKEGRLQVMDLGSQMLAAHCQAQAGQTVVDYCAGAGGKTLFLADEVGPKGRVYAWDASAKRLKEAKTRVAEARLRHVSFPLEPRIDLADVVLVDAPCSGTGTLGREPDQKWKLKKDAIAEFAKTQRSILDTVARAMKPQARLVYGTCSVLHEEDEAVVEAFLAAHPEFSLDGEGAVLRVWPHQVDGGGFFGARFVKR